ncbi:MAG: histidine kinase,GAF protein [Mycobacterium sp.]|jgi:signal transduction histidine kinase|nr:histidine kinase,GAF protein [Mycobacterium sp.]
MGVPMWVVRVRDLMSLALRPTTPSRRQGLVVGASLIVAETVLVYLLKLVAPGNAFGVIFLLGVLVVSAGWGFTPAVTAAVGSALAFDYLRHVPTDFVPSEPQNWIAIVIFVVVALSANAVAGLARSRAGEADKRRREAGHAVERARVLAEQQAALRRVATLVARGVGPSEMFSAVAEELARCLGVCNAALVRYQVDGTSILLAARDEPGLPKMRVGECFPVEGDNVAAMVLKTGRAARVDDHESASGPAAERIHELGLRSGVGAPIAVGGRVWGAAIVGSSRPQPLPPDTEARVEDFADLVATAIANAQSHAELIASRARIVAAADAARHRFERDLHDGAQQRLVALGLELRAAEASVPPELHSLKKQISNIAGGLAWVSEDLREISRGIHPAILSRGGLGPALKTLARRSTVPVDLSGGVDRQLPESVEVAAYYVVSEALTNVAKHARASEVSVCVDADDANLHLSVRDDGIGGADCSNGSGLSGLTDRVEALGGTLEISSQPGSGTSLLVKIPLDIQCPADLADLMVTAV